MKNASLLTICLTALISACSFDNGVLENTNQLSIGMTKAEVVQIMGTPKATRATANMENLTYFWKPYCNFDSTLTGVCRSVDIIVRLVDGKVQAYGASGDFDFSKNPTSDLNISVSNN